MGKVVAYYSTENAQSTTSQNTRKKLKNYGRLLCNQEIMIFCDSTRKKSKQTQYKRMLSVLESGDTVIVPRLYIINKWTGAAFSEVNRIMELKCSLSSLAEGDIKMESGMRLLDEELNVAFYHSKLGSSDEREYETQSKIFELFCKEKTAWNLQNGYYDDNDNKRVNQQPQLEQLVSESHLYDLVIVSSFSRIDLRTARFMKWKEKIGCPIYSLHERLLR